MTREDAAHLRELRAYLARMMEIRAEFNQAAAWRRAHHWRLTLIGVFATAINVWAVPYGWDRWQDQGEDWRLWLVVFNVISAALCAYHTASEVLAWALDAATLRKLDDTLAETRARIGLYEDFGDD